MKNYLKKIGAVIMAATMIFGAGAGVASAAGGKPNETDTATLTVENVDSSATVVGYKIVEAKYGTDGNGLLKYEAVDQVASIIGVEDPIELTEGKIIEIAKQIKAGEVTLEEVTFTNTGGTKFTSASVHAGSYIVLVTGAAVDVDTIYNPLVVSAGYGTDSNLAPGTVDANTLYGETGYAKSSSLGLEKTIIDSMTKDDEGDDLGFGDTAHFQIATRIPDYSLAYTNLTYKLTDTLDAGFTVTEETPVTVTVGKGTDMIEVNPSADTYSLDISDNVITIDFKPTYVLANGEKDVVVTYPAVLNDKATFNFNANKNNVVLEYAKDLNDTKKIEDTTYHYTFAIDGLVNGIQTKELVKVRPSDDGTKTEPLEGAKFTLKNIATKEVLDITSDEDGYLKFKGLDAGSYTLVETEPPAGYTLDESEHTVVITTKINTSGILEEYSITIDEESTSTYYSEESRTDVQNPTEIKNTKIQKLPSTGGTGTYLFTIIGVGLMAVATGMYFFIKKGRASKN